MEKYPFLVRYLVRLLFLFALFTALILTQTLLVPLFFAVLLAYLLYPSASWLEDHHMPRIITNLLLIFGFLVLMGGIGYLIAQLAGTFTEGIPQMQEQLKQNLESLQSTLGEALQISKAQQKEIINNIQTSGSYFGGFFTATANTVVAIGLIPVYTFLLLLYRSKFQKFILGITRPGHRQAMENIINQAAKVVPKYMKGLFIVCFILIGLNSLGFYLIGIKYALLLGILAAVCNLIPYLGTVIGYLLVTVFVLAIQTPSLALGVVIQFFIIQFIENNILTPNITGSYVRINPLVTIFSLIAGSMIWGLAGMFMIIPYLAMLKIICENIPKLEPVAYLLSTKGTEEFYMSWETFKEKFSWSGKKTS